MFCKAMALAATVALRPTSAVIRLPAAPPRPSRPRAQSSPDGTAAGTYVRYGDLRHRAVDAGPSLLGKITFAASGDDGVTSSSEDGTRPTSASEYKAGPTTAGHGKSSDYSA